MALGPSRHMRDSHFPKVVFFCQWDLAIFSTHLPSFRRRCSRKARVLQCWWMPPLAVEGIPGAPSQNTPQWVLQIVREIQKEDLCWGLFAVWNTEGMLFDPFFVAILSRLLSSCRRLLEVAEATVACLGVKFPLRRWTPCPKTSSSQGFRPRCGSNSHFRGRGRPPFFSNTWVKQWYTWLMASHNKSMRCTSKNHERLCLHVPLMEKLPSSDGSNTGQFTGSIYHLRESTGASFSMHHEVSWKRAISPGCYDWIMFHPDNLIARREKWAICITFLYSYRVSLYYCKGVMHLTVRPGVWLPMNRGLFLCSIAGLMGEVGTRRCLVFVRFCGLEFSSRGPLICMVTYLKLHSRGIGMTCWALPFCRMVLYGLHCVRESFDLEKQGMQHLAILKRPESVPSVCGKSFNPVLQSQALPAGTVLHGLLADLGVSSPQLVREPRPGLIQRVRGSTLLCLMYQRKNQPRNEQQKACDNLVMTFLQVDGSWCSSSNAFIAVWRLRTRSTVVSHQLRSAEVSFSATAWWLWPKIYCSNIQEVESKWGNPFLFPNIRDSVNRCLWRSLCKSSWEDGPLDMRMPLGPQGRFFAKKCSLDG